MNPRTNPRKVHHIYYITMRRSYRNVPAGSVREYEGGLQDVVVVGAGISGLVTAQAFVAEHADSVKR